jgi:hypothetical protein
MVGFDSWGRKHYFVRMGVRISNTEIRIIKVSI